MFLRQVVRLSDEQKALTLLTECLPLPGEIKAAQEMILDVVSERFSPEVAAKVQQAIASSEDMPLLRKFLRRVACLSDEQEVIALLAQLFPNSEEAQ